MNDFNKESPLNAAALHSFRDFFLGAQMDLAQALMLDGSESFVCGDFQLGRQLRLRLEVDARVDAAASQALSFYNEKAPLIEDYPTELQEDGMAVRAALVERSAHPQAHLYHLIFEAAFREVAPASAAERSAAPSEQVQL